ncbi:GNAT family N-acetyltransferase [Amycolatopsis sp. NPDC006125]|uniref:GNAT family N-acetyltransferase n=1 Tax=Amycolatopsis sp. NPDC006125 TaxID=3156730 RepID=UPI0033AF48A7
MHLRADWMSRVLTVPYIPVLGPTHPDLCTPEMFTELFADVLTASRAGVALPFDKDRRWSPAKADMVLVDEILHRPDHTIIPVLSRRGGGTVKTYFYGDSPDFDALRAATRRWCRTLDAASGRVIWFSTNVTGQGNHTRVLLKDFNHPAPEPPRGPAVTDLDDCDLEVAATFTAFATAMAHHGFDFLRQRRDAGHPDGPILVTQADRHVVGAIGPLTIMPDRSGREMLLPQYFGVVPGHRGHGHGRALWRAVERWAAEHRADYQLLQARTGGASDQLFQSEGLRPLGYVSTVPA